MSSSPQIIAIAGVTGRLGSLVATYLLENTNCIVHGLCRSPEKVSQIVEAHPSRFKVFVFDVLSLEDARNGIAGCSTVICTYNKIEIQLMIDASKILIQACDAEGVYRFIPSDFTTDYRTIPVGDVPLKDPQIKIWKYIQDGNSNGTVRVKAVHILVGLFAEAFYRFVLTPNNHKYWGTGNEPWDFVAYESTAEYVAKVAADPDRPTGVLKCKIEYIIMPMRD
jgi:NAD(P)H-binding